MYNYFEQYIIIHLHTQHIQLFFRREHFNVPLFYDEQLEQSVFHNVYRKPDAYVCQIVYLKFSNEVSIH